MNKEQDSEEGIFERMPSNILKQTKEWCEQPRQILGISITSTNKDKEPVLCKTIDAVLATRIERDVCDFDNSCAPSLEEVQKAQTECNKWLNVLGFELPVMKRAFMIENCERVDDILQFMERVQGDSTKRNDSPSR